MNLFVGGLSWNTKEDLVREHFEKYGEVAEVKIITDKQSGRSKGFGFVEMPNEEEAKKAIEGLNSTEMDGRTIGVNIAEERKPKEAGSGGRRDFKKRDNNRENSRW